MFNFFFRFRYSFICQGT